MIRSALIPVPTSTRPSFLSAAILCASVLATLPVAADAFSPHQNKASPESYSMTPRGPSDHFVGGKYDRTGTYIPPHYQSVSKPPFHGYFFKKIKPGDKTKATGPGQTAN